LSSFVNLYILIPLFLPFFELEEPTVLLLKNQRKNGGVLVVKNRRK